MCIYLLRSIYTVNSSTLLVSLNIFYLPLFTSNSDWMCISSKQYTATLIASKEYAATLVVSKQYTAALVKSKQYSAALVISKQYTSALVP